MHIPVLFKEVLEMLNLQQGEQAIDCTAGEGGHGRAMAEAVGEKGKVLAIDWDADSLRRLQEKITKDDPGLFTRIAFAYGNFAHLKYIAEQNNFIEADAILFDLGFSSTQLEETDRGLSFQKDEPLDMRFDTHDDLLFTAAQILSRSSEKELERIFHEYGEERYARSIARHIVEKRKREPIYTTGALVACIQEAIPYRAGHPLPGRHHIHFATRSFQALRIAVNHELENLQEGLSGAEAIINKNGGRIAVISFHSLEDRIVKYTFRAWKEAGYGQSLTKKPVEASPEELIKNPRARSAKLRTFIFKPELIARSGESKYT